MNSLIKNYDIYPKVIKTNTPVTIHIKPHGVRPFNNGEYKIAVCALSEGGTYYFPERIKGNAEFTTTLDENGILSFTYDFPLEGQYFVRVFQNNSRILQHSVYAVDEDLAGRIPRLGDLHLHTCRSDGRELPETVAANYRAFGYDFLAITDHHRYYPSLEAMYSYKDVDHALTMVPGEEVQMSRNFAHLINFGGKFSINSLIKDTSPTQDEIDSLVRPGVTKEDVAKFALRALDEANCPEQMTHDEFYAQVDEIVNNITVPADMDTYVEKFTYASCLWVFDKIREADGLSIFAHPYWISDMFQLSESFTDHMLKEHPFDAFEVLGGERYYEQNGYQTAKYYSTRSEGYDYAIVGSTDSHSSNSENAGAYVARTMVFPVANERKALIEAIKDKYSVAIDGILSEPRLVGDFRLIKYTWFLLENYFPLHNKIANEDGRAMLEYCLADNPDDKALYARRIAECKQEMKRLEEKYFAF